MRRLSRTTDPDPVRMAHLGLGAFHRAHQAWWTGAVSRDDPWGIAAFTGRSPAAATALAAQDGLYTLLVRGATSDDAEVVRSISRAADGADTPAFAGCLANPAVRVLTLTVTEAGYCRGDDGGLAFGHPAVAADLRRLVHGRSGAQPPHGLGPRRRAETPRDAEPLRTAPGRVLAGLQERRRADAGPLALVPCDNLIDNGTVLRRVILEFADAVDPGLTGWIVDSVSFVSTAVDRITPRATGEDGQAAARITGWADRAPVVTEPFREWVLSGNFPGGRPAWEEAGAQFVPEVAPFEHRKLWLLNGAHSLLAYGGLLRGHITVAGAIADDTCRRWVSEWWDEASAHLPQPAAALADYREQLLRRFANPRIRHPLSQIAVDGSQKLRVRTVPVLRRERAAGRRGPGALRMLACWIGYVRSESGPLEDPLAARLRSARDARDFLAVLDAELAADDELCAGLDELAAEYREGR